MSGSSTGRWYEIPSRNRVLRTPSSRELTRARGMKAMANSNGSGFAQASENKSRSLLHRCGSDLLFLWGWFFCHALVKETKRQVLIKRWFIQYNSGRASNIGDITKKALEAGCAVAQYVNLRFLRRGPDPGQTGRQ